MNKKQLLTIIGVCIVCLFLGSYFTKRKVEYKEVVKEIKVFERKIDTVKIHIKADEKEVDKKKNERKQLKDVEKLIKYDTINCKEIVDNLKEQLENCDKVVELKDTIIYKERKVIEYKDRIIEKMVIPKPKRIGVGIQVGYGTDLNKINPYIGVGVSYNLFNF